MKSDSELLEKFNKDKKEADTGLATQRENTRKCQAFYAGDFMEYVDYVQFKDANGRPKRTMVQINKVKPYVNACSGHFAQNRRKPAYVANMDSPVQEAYSQYATELSKYIRGNANADQVESEADMDMLVNGYSAVETALSYGDGYATDEQNGEIIMGALDPLSVWWDSSACAKNLLDARFCGVTKQFHIDDALALFSDSEESDFEEASTDARDGYKFDPNLGSNYDRIRYDFYDIKSGQVNVHFYHWYEIEKYYRADNPIYTMNNPVSVNAAALELEILGEEFGFDGRAEQLDIPKEAKKRIEDAFGGLIQLHEFNKKVYYSAVISGKTVFAKSMAESQQGFKIKFKTGDRDKKNKIWTGMVNPMMEPAVYYNKGLTELMFVIAANAKGGAIIEEDAVEDITEFEEKYAQTDGVVVARSGALAAGKIQEKRKAFAPSGYEEIIGFSDQNFSEVTGIDKTFLGSSDNKNEPAALQRQRIRQVMTVLANYVDSISLYSKEQARLMLDYMRVYAQNNRGSVFRLLGKDGAMEFAQISDDIMAAEFDVDIQDAPQTADEKQENAQSLISIALPLLQVGSPAGQLVLSKAVKYMSIDKKDAMEIAQALNPQQEEVDPAYVKQLEELVQALQNKMQQAQVEETISRTELNKAKVDQVMGDVHKKAADTVRSMSESEQTDIENRILRATGSKEVRVNI